MSLLLLCSCSSLPTIFLVHPAGVPLICLPVTVYLLTQLTSAQLALCLVCQSHDLLSFPKTHLESSLPPVVQTHSEPLQSPTSL